MTVRSLLSIAGIVGFVIDFVPLLGLIFFSPGLGSEGVRGAVIFGLGIVTLALLIVSAMRKRWMWLLAALQLFLLAGVLVESFFGSPLYVGT